ncbi:hypothetical protein FGG08_005948 [Glutinoglossum americanum]|uniref:Up-regulated during septation protein 1 domain-containing protein n=1 Tax=Glutinoglossum americanum TaxID=1670608 RepID=A0A9P8I4H8_9PEZI|nr:hypothetical protein FGG08_005948 [Glutinoglossum americanum]
MNGLGYRKPVNSPNPQLLSGGARNGSTFEPPAPSPRALIDGYAGSLNSPNEERPRYNPLNAIRPRSSVLLNVNDPMAMHLLVETAIVDSQDYEVLSFEEVDEMKKEYTLLSNRIEASKRKLALESKVRDAALSLSRLYSKKGGRGEGSESGAHRHRRSFLGGRVGGSELVNKTDDELAASNRKCEELAQELWRLTSRATEIQKRLLQHTSGILQMTHHGNGKKHPAGAIPQHHMLPPGSPESMYTYPNGRTLSPPLEEDGEFDDRSLYRTPDTLDEVETGYDRRANGGGNVRTQSRSPGRPASQNSDGGQHSQVVIVTERRLEDLNDQLRELIVQANPENKTYERAPRYQPNGGLPWPGAGVEAQLNYLERGLGAMSQPGSAGKRVQDQDYAMEERLEELNIQLCNMVIVADPKQTLEPPPQPQPTGANLQGQIDYLENGLAIVERQLQSSTRNSVAKSTGHQEKVEQYDTVLTGLWEIILSGEDEARQRKQRRRQERAENSDFEDDAADFSPDEDFIQNEEFSLQAFSAKVQWLYSRATNLKEQKNILHRQVKQQRELNGKSDAAKDAEISEGRSRLEQLTEELDLTKKMLREAELEASSAQEQLTVVMERLDNARRESTHREQQRSNEESAALKAEKEARREVEENMQLELKQRQEEIVHLEEELEEITDDLRITRAELQGKAEDGEVRIRELEEELALAVNAKSDFESKQASLQAQIEEKTKLADAAESEARRLEGEMVRLQTELTVSRAELDGAYGTRAQRAAEVAANPAIQRELEDMANRNALLLEDIEKLKAEMDSADGGSAGLNVRVQTLQRELSETIAEYETMTKQSIEAEKEREQLESLIDSLRDRIESLENQLSDEKVRGLGMKNPVIPGAPGGESTGTILLKNEFKKMMRDTRAENAKSLKVSYSYQSLGLQDGVFLTAVCTQAEQEERRKLEMIIRDLKKQQMPVKSGLSNSMVPSS